MTIKVGTFQPFLIPSRDETTFQDYAESRYRRIQAVLPLKNINITPTHVTHERHMGDVF